MPRKKSDDKLKSLLLGADVDKGSPAEVNMSEFISPVAKIKIIGI